MNADGRRGSLRIVVLGSGLALAQASAATPLVATGSTTDVIAATLVEDAESSTSERLCQPFAEFLRQESAAVPRADLSAEHAEFSSKLRDAAGDLKASCLLRARAAFEGPDGPRAALLTELQPQAERLDSPDAKAAARFLQSSAGEHFNTLRRSVALEFDPLIRPWALRFGPALYQDLKLALAAEVGSPPASTAPTPEPTLPSVASVRAARLKSRHLGDGCASFYPIEARRLGQEGVVTLLVQIGVTGRLTSVQVESTSGFPALDVAAAACIGSNAEFEPQTIEGRAVSSWQRLRWRWSISAEEPPATAREPGQ
jgi:TonB family protein